MGDASSNLNSEQILKAKQLVKEGLIRIVTEVNKFAGKTETLPRNVSWLSLNIASETSTSFPLYWHLDFEVLRTFFQSRFMEPDFREVRTPLEQLGFFHAEPRYNPQLTYFGAIVANYFSIMTEHAADTEFASRFPVAFNEEVFQNCWDGILPWITDVPLQFKAYYLLFRVNFEGGSFTYDLDKNQLFVVPDFKQRMALANSLKIPIHPLEGMNPAMSRALCFASCGAWIEGEFELLLNDFRSPNHELPIELQHPSYIEEALVLLGSPFAKVLCLIINHNLHYESISLHPLPNGRVSWSRGFRQFPQWMDQFSLPFPIKQPFDLTKLNRWFLQNYPKMRKTVPIISIEASTLTRFMRATNSRLFNDALLEIVMGLESLVTQSSADASLQFRLNISWLLGQRYEDRVLLEFISKHLYTIRSKIVHSDGLIDQSDRSIKKLGGIQATIKIAQEIFRLMIFRLFVFEGDSMQFIARNVLEEELPRLRLGKAFKHPINEYYNLFYNESIAKIVNLVPQETLESIKYA